MTEPAGGPAEIAGGAPVERGWGKLILALVAFFLLPFWPQIGAFVPIERTMLLFVPALAACSLVGWWAGGRMALALIWVGMAVLLAVWPPPENDSFYNLARGWSLLLAGSFGLVCLFGTTGPFFPKALVALGLSLLLALVMSSFGPVSAADARDAMAEEFARRNGQTMSFLATIVQKNPERWQRLTSTVPWLVRQPAGIEDDIRTYSRAGLVVFPALLALQSLVALALAWTTYHRLSRARLGPPLRRLGDFRFNEQLVWGLIVGTTIVFLPTLAAYRGLGWNLLVFFGALYAIRGIGVVSWFMSRGVLLALVAIGLLMLLTPILTVNIAVIRAFALLAAAAVSLGIIDTWIDWRRLVRPTS